MDLLHSLNVHDQDLQSEESDLNANQNRLNMPIKQLKTRPDEFLTADEIRTVYGTKEGIAVRVVGPMLQMYEKSLWLKTWHMKHTDNFVLKTNCEDELISLDEYIDNMDEKQNAIYYIENLQAYKEKKFVDVSKEDLELGKLTFDQLLMKAQTLGDTSTLEFMRGRSRRIMEVNPDHPIIKDLNPDNPAELGGKIYEMMAVALGGKWGRVEESEDSATDSSEPTGETEVVEPSEVRTETDPWST
ncbi:hypothetical protein E3N88_15886 [Mikania micrantha]|uniref:Uncharacterized protein n=1 Tax=Mikania micrantha TaxID=192012 RepID=A0A5N6NZG2_9ASTR|nr:hypothetical protein E3N88_15886 [Mikania micrantha]